MKYLKLISAGLFIGALAYLLIFYKPLSKSVITVAPTNLESQTSFEGVVSVTVLPRNLSEKSVWEFEVALDTHSVELNEDLVGAFILVDDKGLEHQPLEWKGDTSGSHHRTGVLSFDPIVPLPRSIDLKIHQVGGVSERSFVWLLNNH